MTALMFFFFFCFASVTALIVSCVCALLRRQLLPVSSAAEIACVVDALTSAIAWLEQRRDSAQAVRDEELAVTQRLERWLVRDNTQSGNVMALAVSASTVQRELHASAKRLRLVAGARNRHGDDDHGDDDNQNDDDEDDDDDDATSTTAAAAAPPPLAVWNARWARRHAELTAALAELREQQSRRAEVLQSGSMTSR